MSRSRRLIGVVLAAGSSTRMGRSKALLPCPDADETFVARAARVLREGGVAHVAIIVRPSDPPLYREVDRIVPRVSLVENHEPARGQLSSLIAGLDHAEAHGADAVLVLPVDMPLVRAASISALLEAAEQRPALIARVVYGGRHGHPVLFRRPVFGRLRAADPDEGARGVVRACATDVLDVPVDDPGVLKDIDRPDEYRQIFDRPGEL